MEFSREYLVHYYEIDNKKRLTIAALIHYFQDMAILHSEKVGYTLDYYEKTNQGFMILKWDINVYRWPVFNETINIVTRPYSFKKFLANRAFKVYDKDGKLIADGDTGWVFADTLTRRPIRVPEELHKAFGVDNDAQKLYRNLDDLQPLENGEYKYPVKVQNSDIDTNNHVNNVRYIEWALRSLPAEFLLEHQLTNAKVNYKKELQLGDEAEVITSIIIEEDGVYSRHSLIGGGKEICHLQFTWVRITITE